MGPSPSDLPPVIHKPVSLGHKPIPLGPLHRARIQVRTFLDRRFAD